MTDFPPATLRFLEAAKSVGLDARPVFYPEGTKTAAKAAAAVGCDVAAIVKSLVFVSDDGPVLVLMSGDLRVDENLLSALVGGPVRRAALDEVREFTGYAAGGTPPVGHARTLTVYADPSLRRNEIVWAAAGTPNTVFPVPLEKLVTVADAIWADLAEGR